MKKHIALVLALIFAFGIFYTPAVTQVYAKEYKIGFVDLAKIFEEYKRTKESEKILNEKRKVKEDERKRMVDELRKLKDEQSLLSDKAKGEKQTVIDNKIKVLQDFDTKTRDDLLKDRNDLLGGILKDIEKIVADYAKEKGYDFILNSRVLLYGTDQEDLTTEVLSRLNK